MAAKKTTGKGGESEQLVAAAEELRKAAELLMNKASEPESATSKKTSTKKSTPAKKTTTAKSTTSKPKSTTSKPKEAKAEPKAETKTKAASKPKTTAKKEPKAEEPKEEPVEEVKEEPVEVKEEPAPAPEVKEEPVKEVKEEPVPEVKEESAPAPEVKQEPKEEPAPAPASNAQESVTIYCPKCGARNTSAYKFCLQCGAPLEGSANEQPKNEAAASAAPSEKRSKKIDMGAVADKTQDFIQNKGKLPIFIVVNALFLVCTILLMTLSFSISILKSGVKDIKYYNMFTYLANAKVITHYMEGSALTWAEGGYAMIGILMVLAMLLPVVLIIKNLILLFVKKDKNVYKLDAVIVFAFMLFYITMISFYGLNVPAGPLVSFIVAAVALAFTIFADLLINRKNGQKFPFFSVAVIALVVVCEFIFSSTPVYTAKDGGSYYGAAAASASNGGFMAVTYLVAVLALIALVVIQLWKLPSLIDLILPAAAAVCALITLIVPGAGMPDDCTIGGGFVVGTILTLILAAAYLVFTLVPALKKFKVQLNVTHSTVIVGNSGYIDAHVEQNVNVEESAPVSEPEPAPAPEPAPVEKKEEPKKEAAVAKVFCTECGAQNEATSKFCHGCGHKLKD